MRRVTLLLDDDDAIAVAEAIVERMENPVDINGETILPCGESNRLGALIAEICRAFTDYREEIKLTDFREEIKPL